MCSVTKKYKKNYSSRSFSGHGGGSSPTVCLPSWSVEAGKGLFLMELSPGMPYRAPLRVLVFTSSKMLPLSGSVVAEVVALERRGAFVRSSPFVCSDVEECEMKGQSCKVL